MTKDKNTTHNVYAAVGDFNDLGEIIAIPTDEDQLRKAQSLWNTTDNRGHKIQPIMQDIVTDPKDDIIYAIGKHTGDNNLYAMNESQKKEISIVKNMRSDPDHIAIDATKGRI